MNYRYNWSFGVHDLAGRNNAWLRAACRERSIKASRMNRKQIMEALVDFDEIEALG